MLLAEDLERPPVRYQGNWIPHKLRAGDRGRHLLRRRLGRPLPAADRGGDPHRVLLRDQARARAARGGRRAPGPRRRRSATTPTSSTARVEVPLDAPRPAARSPGSRRGLQRAVIRALRPQALRRLGLRALPADRPAGLRKGHQAARLGAEGAARKRREAAAWPHDAAAIRLGPSAQSRRPVSARQQQADARDPAGAERGLLEAEEADPIEDHGGGELPGDRRRRDSARADLADERPAPRRRRPRPAPRRAGSTTGRGRRWRGLRPCR